MFEFWIDAQLSPSLALWINQNFENVQAKSLRSLGMRDATDRTIFFEAKKQNAVIISKDADFIKLLEEYGPPPRIIWVTVGNSSNRQMRDLLTNNFTTMINMLAKEEKLIEIGGNL